MNKNKDLEELDIEDLEADGWSCNRCPRKKQVYNSKLECNFQDCLFEYKKEKINE